MAGIGIVGAGIAGLQLGLLLRQHRIDATIYAEKSPAQLLASPVRNIVCRNGCTRARERLLGVNHWDGVAPDLCEVAVSVVGTPVAFAGGLTPPSQIVDMRIYCSQLLEDFVARGGDVVLQTLGASDLDELSLQHELLVVASGRSTLSSIFPRVPEHSPYDKPQRAIMAGMFRGIRYREPLGFEVYVSRGHGEILVLPLHSFETGLTALGILAKSGGAFDVLKRIRHNTDPRAFEAAVLGLLRDHAPDAYARVDPSAFGVARPLDVGLVAITPTVRQPWTRLPSGRPVMALGDAHIIIDPITGQGANKASHGAWVLGEAIRDNSRFDEAFCDRVGHEICAFALAVSDASNARLQPAEPHVARLMGAASQHQALADFYGFGFNHPDRYWQVVSSEEPTNALLKSFAEGVHPGAFTGGRPGSPPSVTTVRPATREMPTPPS